MLINITLPKARANGCSQLKHQNLGGGECIEEVLKAPIWKLKLAAKDYQIGPHHCFACACFVFLAK